MSKDSNCLVQKCWDTSKVQHWHLLGGSNCSLFSLLIWVSARFCSNLLHLIFCVPATGRGLPWENYCWTGVVGVRGCSLQRGCEPDPLETRVSMDASFSARNLRWATSETQPCDTQNNLDLDSCKFGTIEAFKNGGMKLT